MNVAVATVLVAALCAAACAAIGLFLVLRRSAMVADAISHAILPGLVLGYVFVGGPGLLGGMIGAAVAGVVLLLLTNLLVRSGIVEGSAALGVVFPAMFALGAAIVARDFANVHLDADAVLYGNIEFVAFDRLVIAGHDLGPRPLWLMAGLALANLLAIWRWWPQLKVTTFDPGLALTIGIAPGVVQVGLMTLLTATSVGAFTAVGAALAIALLVAPPATALLLTDRLGEALAVAVAIGIAGAALGYRLAVLLDASVAGAIVTVLGAGFVLALLIAPAHGAIPRWVRRRRTLIAPLEQGAP